MKGGIINMGRKKKNTDNKKLILVLSNGSKHEILSKTGKYYHCIDTSFRIARSDYQIVAEYRDAQEPELEIEISEDEETGNDSADAIESEDNQ